MIRMRRILLIISAVLLAFLAWWFLPEADSERIGKVTSKVRFFSPNDSIVLNAFNDPKVSGVTCYLSRAKTGGYRGAVGLSEDSSDASISCTKITEKTSANLEKLADSEEVFSVKTSPIFKSMRVERLVDRKRNVVIYLVYAGKWIDGSPKNSNFAIKVDVDTSTAR